MMMEATDAVAPDDVAHSHSTPITSSKASLSYTDISVYTVFHVVNDEAKVQLLRDKSRGNIHTATPTPTVAAASDSQRPGPVYSDAQVAAEVSWLDRYTSDGSSWSSIRDRVSQMRTAVQKRARRNRSGLADRFISNLPSSRHSSDHQRDAVVADVCRSLLQQSVDDSILAVCSELIGSVCRAWGLLVNAIVPAAAGISERTARFSRISGREHLAQGLLSDCRYELQREGGLVSKRDFTRKSITMPTMKKSTSPMPACATILPVSLNGDVTGLGKWLPGLALRDAEADYWKRVAVSPIAGGPLQCPPSAGYPSAVRLFTPCCAVPSSRPAVGGRRRGASSILACGRIRAVYVCLTAFHSNMVIVFQVPA